MQFGSAIGTACLTFTITNIDDAFVLVTFFAESAHNKALTPLKITIGQYVGFTVVMIISMIGFGVSLVLPSEPIGFLGLLPILLGIWNALDIVVRTPKSTPGSTRSEGMKSIFKVAVITIMNGGDNIGTYIPLFSQVKGVEIAVYVVVYYILLGVWCLIGFLIMKQNHILRVAEKYMGVLIPFLYMGLGVYIIVKSDAYPWSVKRINDSISHHPGRAILATMTVFVLCLSIGIMIWIKMSRRRGVVSDETITESHAAEHLMLENSSVPKEPIATTASEKPEVKPSQITENYK